MTMTIPPDATIVHPPHGFVRLVEFAGSDLSVVNAARVSYDQESKWEHTYYETGSQKGLRLNNADSGLLRYLMTNRHGTPFEHNYFQFHVRAPIFVFREWHRHRIGYCVTGDAIIDFVDINGHRASGICRTLQQLHDRWEHDEINGHATDQDRLSYALTLVDRGTSVRMAAARSGVARGTLTRCRCRHCQEVVKGDRRGSRWRIEGMRIRTLDEATGRFTHSHIEDVIQSGVKEVIRLDLAHSALKLTSDHKVLTPEGWRGAGSLSIGDLVARPGKVTTHERQIPSRLREGIGLWTTRMRSELISDEDFCYRCDKVFPHNELILDHVVPVVQELRLALDPNNLRPICSDCHRSKTSKEQKFTCRSTMIGVRWERVLSAPKIFGEEMTYDLSVAGHHNFVANGVLVHNSINEESGRYVELQPDFYLPDDEHCRKQVGKPGHYTYEQVPEVHAKAIRDMLDMSYRRSYSIYQILIGEGVAKEIARAALPMATYSQMLWTCNARSLMAFLSLRNAPTAQREIKDYAQAMEDIFLAQMPVTAKAFIEFDRVAP